MGGPACEVLLEVDDDSSLFEIDAILAASSTQIERTRKGRVWDVWIANRPIHVSVERSPPTVTLVAGFNGQEDYGILRKLAGEIATTLGGVVSEPVK